EQFIRMYIENVDQLRSILLLKGNPETFWTVTEVAVKTYLSPAAVAAALGRLVLNGLVTSEGDPPVFSFNPRTPELAAKMDEVARLDRERPVTLLQIVYERPDDIRAFTDAFKIRKPKDD